MRTRGELYSEARRIVAGRKQKAITLAQQAREKAAAALPDLLKLEDEARHCGFQAARLAASGADHSVVEATLQKGRDTRARRDELLRQNGYNPEMLEPRYTCPLCKDSGTLNGRPCKCIISLTRQMRREEMLSGSALSLTSFDSLDLAMYPLDIDKVSGMSIRDYMKETLGALRAYAETFDLNSSSLLIFGNAGLGKTHAALSIASTVLERGYDVIYISAQDMCSQLERARFDDDSSLMDAMLEADLLILDDLGTESMSSYTLSCLYTLVNTRMAKRRPTIYTTNIVNSAMLEKRYTEKIASRLSGSCEPVEFLGNDIRQILQMQ